MTHPDVLREAETLGLNLSQHELLGELLADGVPDEGTLAKLLELIPQTLGAVQEPADLGEKGPLPLLARYWGDLDWTVADVVVEARDGEQKLALAMEVSTTAELVDREEEGEFLVVLGYSVPGRVEHVTQVRIEGPVKAVWSVEQGRLIQLAAELLVELDSVLTGQGEPDESGAAFKAVHSMEWSGSCTLNLALRP